MHLPSQLSVQGKSKALSASTTQCGHAAAVDIATMAFTRRQSREKQKYTFVKSEYAASEADSTVARWGPAASQAPKRRARKTEACNQHGTDWQNLPDGPLLRIFDILFTNKAAAEDLHNAAATCTQWREAFLEVTLGDTAASRPERPPLQDDNVKKEAPATTATACAAVCEPSKSEPDDFEACSIRRQAAVGATAPAAQTLSAADLAAGREYVGQARHATLGPLAAALTADALAGAAADAEVAHNDVPGPPQATGQRQQQRHRGQGRTAQHADLADLSPSEQLQRREHVAAAADGSVEHDTVDLQAGRRRLPTAAAAAGRARRRSGSSTGTEQQVASPTNAVTAAAEVVHGPLAAAAHHGCTKGPLARRVAATQQQGEQDDDSLQPVAARRTCRQHAAAAAGDASDDGGAVTDEVVQPTTAEGGEIPAATGRRRRHRASARTSSAAAAAAGPAVAAGAVTGERERCQAGHLLVAASNPRPHSRRLQHRRTGPQQHQQEQQQPQEHAEAEGQLQLPADSTEAVAQGEPVSGGAAGAAANGSQSRQNSGSNRPAGESAWFGGLFHLPSWLRRGGSS